jgi:uncharacterized GH25 family protein
MKRLILPSLLALSLLAPPLTAHAHRSWLLPSQSFLTGKNPTVSIDGSVSDNLFQTDAFALKLDGLMITAPDGSPLQPQEVATAKQRSSFDVTLPQPGTYRIAVAGDTVMASYRLNGEMQRFRGAASDMTSQIPAGATDVRVMHVLSRFETWVTLDAPTLARLKPVGRGLEIIPLSDPSAYAAGEAASFRAYLDGKPLAGLMVQIIPGGVRYRGDLKETDATTDASGAFTVTWPMAQMYWIGASYPPREPEGEHNGAKSGEGGRRGPVEPGVRYSYAGTFEVMPF